MKLASLGEEITLDQDLLFLKVVNIIVLNSRFLLLALSLCLTPESAHGLHVRQTLLTCAIGGSLRFALGSSLLLRLLGTFEV